MKMLRKKKNKRETEEIVLAEGLLLCTEEIREDEPRILTLLLKGFLVYLIVMGTMGSFLTSLDIRTSWWVIHLVVFLGALFCSLLYYNRIWQNIGYFVLLFVMLSGALWFRSYISSGVFAVGNELSRRAAVFFDSNAQKSYVEQIGNRAVTIPVAMCYVGWVADIVFNVMISRRMRYVAASVLCAGTLFVPLYLEREPSMIYIVMMAGGLLLTFITRKNGHYQLSAGNRRYAYETKKKRLGYVYAGRTAAGVTALVLVLSFVLLGLLGLVLPEERYEKVRTASVLKAGTMDSMENFTLIGIMGLFNYYPNTGGLTSGTLGGVSAIRLDYETDLTVTFTPYNVERLYLKSFTGAEYLPVKNQWSRMTDERGLIRQEEVEDTQTQQKILYDLGLDQTARGRMRITNVAAPVGLYLPYYSLDIDRTVPRGSTQEYTYYPMFQDEYYRVLSYPDLTYLRIPGQNRETIAEFCQEAGITGGDVDTVAKQLADYFQKNIPYTIRPGATPYRQDFINYFLTKNRRGYCAHFASAATLIFRYCGIPARYVEGYAIDPSDITEEGTVLTEEKFGDYYQGYAPMGESAVVSVDVLDANAHAWVEVFDMKNGWRTVEVTPASTESRSSGGGGLWQQLFDFLMGDADAGSAGGDDPSQNGGGQTGGSGWLEAIGDTAGKILAVLACFALAAFPVRWLLRWCLGYIRYRRAGRNDKLILWYTRYIRRLMRRNPSLREQLNYREQLQMLVSENVCHMDDREFQKAVALLEQAGFSSREISEEELAWMRGRLKRM